MVKDQKTLETPNEAEDEEEEGDEEKIDVELEQEKEQQQECSCYINSTQNRRSVVSHFNRLAKVTAADMSLMLLRNWSALQQEAGEEESVNHRMDCSISDNIMGQTRHKWTLRIYSKC